MTEPAAPRSIVRRVRPLRDLFRRRLGRVLRSAFPDVSGNEIVPVDPSGRFFERMAKAIDTAERTVDVEMYLWHDDEVGATFVDALARAALRGVRVRIVADAQGSREVLGILGAVRRAGGDVRVFNPFRIRWWRRYFTRTHKKLLLIDGTSAWTGGAGFSLHFSGVKASEAPWHDRMFEFRGPMLAQFQAVFEADFGRWRAEGETGGGSGPGPGTGRRGGTETGSGSEAGARRGAGAAAGTGAEASAGSLRESGSGTGRGPEPEPAPGERRRLGETAGRGPDPGDRPAPDVTEPIRPAPSASGPATARVLRSWPDARDFRPLFMRAIREARERVWIGTPYFLPPHSVRRELYRAAARGVDVRVVVPALPHAHPLFYYATRARYGRYLRRGVRLHEFGEGFYHAKTFVADRTVAIIGSSNLDSWSWRRNAEIDIALSDAATVDRIADLLAADRARSHEVDPSEARVRDFVASLKQTIASRMEDWL